MTHSRAPGAARSKAAVPPRSRGHARSVAAIPPKTRGMTMVEVCISMVVLMVAVGGTLSSISSHLVLGTTARETAVAYLEAERLVERLKAEPFAQLFARYNDSVDDDPVGPPVPGANFDLPGFTPWPTDPDGRVGRIFFPVAEGDPGMLREDITFNGRTLDLDADGDIDPDDRSLDYALLPVRVRVQWRGQSGNRFIELQTILITP
jgi:hypothetical protein